MAPNFSFLAKLNWKVDTGPLTKADVATKKLEKDTTKLGKESKKTEKDAKGLAKGIESVEKSSKKAKESLSKLGTGVVNIGKSMAKIGLASAAMAAAAVAATAVSMVTTNKETTLENKKARSVGFTAEQYAQFGGAVKALGFEQEKVVDMADEMNKVLSETKSDPKKLKEFKDQLKELGLNFETFMKLNPGEKFKTLFDSAAGSKNPEKILSIIDKIFKGDATKVLVALSKSGTSLAQLALKQKELSFETQKTREQAEEFTKSFDKLTGQLDSIKSYSFATLGASLVPLLEDMSTFIQNNKDLIKTKLDEFIKNVADSVKSLWVYFKDEKNQKMIKETFISIKDSLEKIAANIGPITKAVGAILGLSVLITIGKGIATVWGVIVPIFEFIGAAAGTTAGAVAIIAAGIAGWGYAIYSVVDDWKFLSGVVSGWWEDLTKFASKTWEDITKSVEKASVDIVIALKPIETFFSNLYINYIKPIVDAILFVSNATMRNVPKSTVAPTPTPAPTKKPFENYGPPEMKSYFDFQTNTPQQMKSVPVGSQTSGAIPVVQNISNKSNDTYVVNNEWTINTKVTKEFNEQELKRIVVAQQDERAATMFQSRSKRT